MSISVPTDIVLDVARAADPQRMRAAIRKLESAGGETGADFATLVARPEAKHAGAKPALRSAQAVATSAPPLRKAISSAAASSTEAAYQALGGVLLQKTFETAMPDGATSIFGKGTAGSMWKSLLAQQLAGKMSASFFKLPKADATRADDHVAAPAVAAS